MTESPWSRSDGAQRPDPAAGAPYDYPVPPQWPDPSTTWPAAQAWHQTPVPAPRQRNGWLIACIATVAVVISLGFIAPFAFGAYLTSQVQDDIATVTGKKTDEILANNLDVTIGSYTPRRDSYSATGKLAVTFKNKGAERASFDLTIEAVDDQGRRIEEILTYAEDLAPGQSFTRSVLVLPDDTQAAEQLLHAKFQVLSVSMQ